MSDDAPDHNWVVILGATSGIGKAIARHWAANGQSLILAARDAAELERNAADLQLRYGVQIKTIAFDALAFDQHERFWQECLQGAAGQIHGVVLCYGYMAPQSDAQDDPAIARLTCNTNYASPVSILERAASELASKKSGYLCAVSSVAGDRGRLSNYIYGSSKAALNVYLQGLRIRLFRSRVSVTTLKPGFIDTAMTWGLPGMFLVATPEQVARDAWDAVHRRRAVVYTPWFWRYIMLIIRHIPDPIFKRMKL